MRIFGSVVRALVLDVLYTRHQSFHLHSVAAQTVSHNPSRQRALRSQDLPEKLLSCIRIPTTLNKDLDHLAYLIDS
jgi:hypothetical protein